MRKFKKGAALLLCLMLATALCMAAGAEAAVAAGPQTQTNQTDTTLPENTQTTGENEQGDPSLALPVSSITLTAPSGQSLSNRSFAAYQLFTVTSSYVQNGVEHFNYVPVAWLQNALQSKLGPNQTPLQYVQAMENAADYQELSQLVKAYVGSHPEIKPKTAVGNNQIAYFGMVSRGYYLIFETTKNMASGITPVLCMLGTTNIIATAKSATVTLTKEVVTATGTGLDYNGGDQITYRLKAVMPNLAGNSKFDYVFTDTLDTGLTLDKSSVKLTINGQDKTTAGAVNLQAGESGFTLGIRFLDDKGNPNEEVCTETGKDIVVSYRATLNGKANTIFYQNSATLGYGADPKINKIHAEKYISTYGFNILKINPSKEKLAGAVFSLQQPGGRYFTFANRGGTYFVTGSSETLAESAKLTSGTNGTILIWGLKTGTYTLSEVTPPQGYNPATTPWEIKLSVKPRDASEEQDAANELQSAGSQSDCYTMQYRTQGTSAWTTARDKCIAIENEAGIALPATGGNGMAAGALGGLALVLCGLLPVGMGLAKRKRLHGC